MFLVLYSVRIYFFFRPSIMGRKENRLCGRPPTFEYILEINKEFLSNKEAIPNIVNLAYDKVEIYINRFEPIRENYRVDKEMNPTTIRSEKGMFI